MAKDTLPYLPNEILLKIAEEVTDRLTLKRVRSTCRLLNEHCKTRVLENLAITIDEMHVISATRLFTDPSYIGVVRSLRLQAAPPPPRQPLPSSWEWRMWLPWRRAVEAENPPSGAAQVPYCYETMLTASNLCLLVAFHGLHLRKLVLSCDLNATDTLHELESFLGVIRTLLDTARLTALECLRVESSGDGLLNMLWRGSEYENFNTNMYHIREFQLAISEDRSYGYHTDAINWAVGRHTERLSLEGMLRPLDLSSTSPNRSPFRTMDNLTYLKMSRIKADSGSLLCVTLRNLEYLQELEVTSFLLPRSTYFAWCDVFDDCRALQRLKRIEMHCLHYYESNEEEEGGDIVYSAMSEDRRMLGKLRRHADMRDMVYRLEDDGLGVSSCGSENIAHGGA